MTAKSVVRMAGEGERRWFHGGGTHTWKVTSEDSNGAFFLFEDELTQGKMTPLHCHPDTDEAIYVLEGDIGLHIDGAEQRIGTRGMWMVPRGVSHAFTVVSARARLLSFQAPGISQPFYWDASEPATAPNGGPVDFDSVRRVAAATGATTMLGPPPFAAR